MLTLFLFLQDLLPVYSYEEKALMAEILREDQLNEKREKARNEDMKLHDAKLRRMFQAAQAVAVRKERLVYIHIYSKTCVKRPLKKRQTKHLNDKW